MTHWPGGSANWQNHDWDIVSRSKPRGFSSPFACFIHTFALGTGLTWYTQFHNYFPNVYPNSIRTSPTYIDFLWFLSGMFAGSCGRSKHLPLGFMELCPLSSGCMHDPWFTVTFIGHMSYNITVQAFPDPAPTLATYTAYQCGTELAFR